MDNELLKCEFCGKMGYPNEFLRSKRFCTMSCAKRYVGILGFAEGEPVTFAMKSRYSYSWALIGVSCDNKGLGAIGSHLLCVWLLEFTKW